MLRFEKRTTPRFIGTRSTPILVDTRRFCGTVPDTHFTPCTTRAFVQVTQSDIDLPFASFATGVHVLLCTCPAVLVDLRTRAASHPLRPVPLV